MARALPGMNELTIKIPHKAVRRLVLELETRIILGLYQEIT